MSTPHESAIAYIFRPWWGYGSALGSSFKLQVETEVETAPRLSTSPQAVDISIAGETCAQVVLS